MWKPPAVKMMRTRKLIGAGRIVLKFGTRIDSDSAQSWWTFESQGLKVNVMTWDEVIIWDIFYIFYYWSHF